MKGAHRTIRIVKAEVTFLTDSQLSINKMNLSVIGDNAISRLRSVAPGYFVDSFCLHIA